MSLPRSWKFGPRVRRGRSGFVIRAFAASALRARSDAKRAAAHPPSVRRPTTSSGASLNEPAPTRLGRMDLTGRRRSAAATVSPTVPSAAAIILSRRSPWEWPGAPRSGTRRRSSILSLPELRLLFGPRALSVLRARVSRHESSGRSGPPEASILEIRSNVNSIDFSRNLRYDARDAVKLETTVLRRPKRQ